MSTSHRIQDIVYNHPTGDVEAYFRYLDDLISVNSGNHDYRILSHDSYQISVPIPENQSTKFKITDQSMDIVDISQCYLNLKCKISFDYLKMAPNNQAIPTHKTYADNFTYFFVGFKSGAHIIDQYNVFSNGRLTACKQTKAKYEQTVVYNSKAKEEKRARPGMYSAHKDVMKMRDCVCGRYIQCKVDDTVKNDVEFDIVIQIDDLLPFSAMTYYPRFAVKDLELEIICNLQKNMVFCQVPYEEVVRHVTALGTTAGTTDHTELGKEMANNVDNNLDINSASTIKAGSSIPIIRAFNHELEAPKHHLLMDTRFHQCGDYARCLLGVSTTTTISSTNHTSKNLADGTAYTGEKANNLAIAPVNDFYCTLKPRSLSITEAKSYIFGFNLNQEAKQKINIMLEKMGQLKIPAQWVDHTSFPQQAGTYALKMNTMMNLYECGQLIITFPNSVNQLTVSRNPMLDAVKCQIDDRVVPDKMMSTYDKAHTEMTLTALGFDSLFAAPPELIQSLSAKEEFHARRFRVKHEDDSNYMFVADLERSGAGVFHDGFSKSNCAINFDGTYHHQLDNPHYYEFDPTKGNYGSTSAHELHKVSPFIFSVCDAYWAFGPNGGEFIKDAATLPLISEIETKKESELQQELAAAGGSE